MLEQFRRSFLSTPVFARRAFTALEALSTDEYWMRSRPGSKELIEEVVPTATLAKYLEVPGRSVRCKYVGGSRDHDAEVRLSGREVDGGFLEPFYYVEVTSASSPHDYLRREALKRHGHVFGGPNIRRVGSRARGDDDVESYATAVDGGANFRNAVKWLQDAVSRKANRNYPRPCILLVDVHPDRKFSLREWASLADAVRDVVDRESFKWTFVVEWGTNVVFSI